MLYSPTTEPQAFFPDAGAPSSVSCATFSSLETSFPNTITFNTIEYRYHHVVGLKKFKWPFIVKISGLDWLTKRSSALAIVSSPLWGCPSALWFWHFRQLRFNCRYLLSFDWYYRISQSTVILMSFRIQFALTFHLHLVYLLASFGRLTTVPQLASLSFFS